MSQKKQPLKWYFPAIAGVFVAIYSKIVSFKNPDNTPMNLFFYIGIVLLLYGIGKYALGKRVKTEDKLISSEKKSYAQKLRSQELKAYKIKQQQNNTPAKHNIIACPKCGTKHYSSSNFCHKCGSRLR